MKNLLVGILGAMLLCVLGCDDGHTHSYGSWSYDATYHWHQCSSCGDITDKGEHTTTSRGITAKATSATCTVCGQSFSAMGD